MMKELSCIEAAKAVNGTFFGSTDAGEVKIEGVAIDSRKMKKNWLYVAIVGERVDGHSFIPQVLENGAACVISEQKLNGLEPYILVENTQQALKDLAEYYRKKLDVTVIGITGSVGKTSTKEMIATVLSQKYCVQKTAGNFNNEIGLPLTVFTIGTEHEIAILEMGISDFGEMSRLSKIAKPDYMVITNIGQCHLENLKSRDGILKAKTECFDYMGDTAKVILNGDDDKLSTISIVHGNRPYFFSIDKKGCHAYASNIQNLQLYGSNCMIHLDVDGKKDTINVHVPLSGNHMVMNAVAAALVGQLLGLDTDQITKGISKAEAMDGRGKMIRTAKYTLIDSCYNANPKAMKAELDLLAYANTRKIALLGDMLELGEEEKELHYDVGNYAATKALDIVICIGSLSEYTAKGAMEAKKEKESPAVYYFKDKPAFMKDADRILKQDDTILIKASNGSGFKELLTFLKEES